MKRRRIALLRLPFACLSAGFPGIQKEATAGDSEAGVESGLYCLVGDLHWSPNFLPLGKI